MFLTNFFAQLPAIIPYTEYAHMIDYDPIIPSINGVIMSARTEMRIGDLPADVQKKLGLIERGGDERVTVTLEANPGPPDAATIARRKAALEKFGGEPVKLPEGVTVLDLIREGRNEDDNAETKAS